MKKLILSVKDFLLFRQVCEMNKIKFDYGYKHGGIVTVKADKELLKIIGY